MTFLSSKNVVMLEICIKKCPKISIGKEERSFLFIDELGKGYLLVEVQERSNM